MGLDALKQKREAAQKPKVSWLKLAPNEKVEVVFLQELDDDFADVYQVEEWTVAGPGKGNFRTLVDTTESEGSCYANEVRAKIYSIADSIEDESERKQFLQDHRARKTQKIYFNVAKVDAPNVALAFGQSITGSLVETLLEDLADEETITGVVYQISKGATAQDSWTIRRKPKNLVPEVTAEPYDIKQLARFIPLADQPTYLEPVEPQIAGQASRPVETPVVEANPSSEW
jgi:hypothetical protein